MQRLGQKPRVCLRAVALCLRFRPLSTAERTGPLTVVRVSLSRARFQANASLHSLVRWTHSSAPSVGAFGAETEPRIATELVSAYKTVTRGNLKAGALVRELATHMPPNSLEYLGEHYCGLAGYCRALAERQGTLTLSSAVSATPTTLTVTTHLCKGALRVFLSPAAAARPRVIPVAGALADALVCRTLVRTIRGTCVPVRHLQEVWGLKHETLAAARIENLVRTLLCWREAVQGDAYTSFPKVNCETGEVARDACEPKKISSAVDTALTSHGDGEYTLPSRAPGTDWRRYVNLVYVRNSLHYVGCSSYTRQTAAAQDEMAAAAEAAADDEAASAGTLQEPRLYDLWRMAAFLSVGKPTPIAALAIHCAEVTEHNPIAIALAFPERVVLVEDDGGTAAADMKSARVEEASHLREVGTCDVSVRCSDTIYKRIVGLSFLLTTEESSLLSGSSVLASLSVEELEERKRGLRLQPPLRRSKLRKRLVRELLRRHYPLGNPFLCGDVVAQYVYDHIEPHKWYSNCALKEDFLPNGGKDTLHVGVDFFHKYPHLFVVRNISSTATDVMRREVDMMEVHGDEFAGSTHKPVSEQELDLSVLAACFSHTAVSTNGTVNLELVFSTLPRTHRAAAKKNKRADVFMEQMTARFPKVFTRTPEGTVLFNRTEAVELVNALSLEVMKTGGDDVTRPPKL